MFDDVTAAELRRRVGTKWRRHGPDVIEAWVAEMDFPPAPAIADAVADAVRRGDAGYPPLEAESDLPAALCDWLRHVYGWSVDPATVFVTSDLLRALETCLDLITPPGTPVVLPTPSYPPFFEVLALASRPVVDVPMAGCDGRKSDGGAPTLDLAGIEDALSGGADAIILCNPHNPLGRAFDRDELLALSDVASAYGARVIADEVHAPLVYPGRVHVPFASLSARAAEQSVTLTSASKGWNIPGLRCAQVVLTNPTDAAAWRKLSWLRTQGAATPGIVANVAAYRSGGPWLGDAVAYLDANRHLLAQLLREFLPELRHRTPEAGYLAWIDCRALPVADPAGFFLRQAKVALHDGALFGPAGKGFVRLNFATSAAILEQMVEAMAGAVRR
ncbi:MAG TPA: aminotransferase class I/II-fold pyridoxal phosphate-dependent enzyme, partial [Acidimicrobiales bacterium]